MLVRNGTVMGVGRGTHRQRRPSESTHGRDAQADHPFPKRVEGATEE